VEHHGAGVAEVAEVNPIDRALVIWLNNFAGQSKPFDVAMQIIATDYLMPLVFSMSMFAMWFAGKGVEQRKRFQYWTLVGISSIGLSNVAVFLLNITWSRTRPYVDLDEIHLLFYKATDPSFPSNPVAIGFAAGSAAWMVDRKFGYFLFAAGLLYGFSRTYAGVFYPSDVLGGAAVGIIVTWLTTYLHRVFQPITNLFIRLVRGLAIG
jgi:undecaprenyl-diphosphatase